MARELRKAMWVRHGNRTAVIVEVGVWPDEDGASVPSAIVHYVNAAGETVLPSGVVPVGSGWSRMCDSTVPLSQLRQATADEIPAARIAGASPEALAALGYE